ncbi:MAG: DUF1071 domain-containing protein [Gallionella sp.]|nr:DUF1071 domain-containing protein [Gallionella sp.]
MESVFKKLYETNVNEHVEKKGEFSYLSWPYAVAQLRLADPNASWEVKRFTDDLPYQKTELGVFVEVAVTVQGVTLSQIHPVLDGKNKPLLEPSAFEINTSLQRCLVKAVALHGLGLYIYAGEDLPQVENQGDASRAVATPKPSQPVRQGEVVFLTGKQLGYINKLVAETKTDVQQLLTFFGFDSLENIPKVEVNRVIRVLENNRQKEAA